MLGRHTDWGRLIWPTRPDPHKARTIRIETANDAMADSTAFWIVGGGAKPPTMYEAARGIEVWANSEETEDGLCYRTTSTAPSHN